MRLDFFSSEKNFIDLTKAANKVAYGHASRNNLKKNNCGHKFTNFPRDRRHGQRSDAQCRAGIGGARSESQLAQPHDAAARRAGGSRTDLRAAACGYRTNRPGRPDAADRAVCEMRANPLMDSICIDGMGRVAKSLRRAFHDGGDKEARRDMALQACAVAWRWPTPDWAWCMVLRLRWEGSGKRPMERSARRCCRTAWRLM